MASLGLEPGVDLKKLFKVLEFEPHSKAQWEYCESTARFNVPTCGRRWGKSIATGHKMTRRLFVPDTYHWLVGPTYRLGEKEFRVIYRDILKLEALGMPRCKKTYNAKQGDMRIEMPWDTILEVVSAERPNTLVGEGLDSAVMCEAALHTQSIWDQFIEPALSDKLGVADFPSTPRGYNWYYGMFQLGQDPNSSEYKSWQLPSWTNPIRYPGGLDNDEIQRIKQRVSKQYFDQEYGAKFTTFVGQIYDEFDPTVHVKKIEYNPEWRNYLAFDFGFANPTCVLDIMVAPDDTAYVWREYYVRYKSSYEHSLALMEREQPDGYHIDAMFGDPRGADEIAIYAHNLGFISGRPVPWKAGVEAIKRALKLRPDGYCGLYVDPGCLNLARQLEQLHIKEQRAGSLDLSETTGDGNIQHKYDDHAVDALRYFFGEFFVLGAGASLSDVYTPGYLGSEADEFFRLRSGVTLDSHIGF